MNFPQPFIESIQTQFDEDEAYRFFQSLESPSPVSFRVNHEKHKALPNLERVKWNEQGYYLEKRPAFFTDPLWHAGGYYVQESSSMIIGTIIGQLKQDYFKSESIHVLDLCAAPGGKSTDIVSQLSEEDLLISNEVIQSRVGVLRENVVKWGYPNHLVSSNDPTDFKRLPAFFDMVVVDAPCSGEGLFRKEPESINHWSMENVNLCHQRQQRIVQDAWDTLATNGFLIYSTCTYNTIENESILKWLTKDKKCESVEIQMELSWGFSRHTIDNHTIFKAFPHLLKGEGFSFFVVRKTELVQSIQTPKKLDQKILDRTNFPLVFGCDGAFIQEQDQLMFRTHPKEVMLLQSKIRLIRSGVEVGNFKREKLIPSHEIAMQIDVNLDYETKEVDWDQAIKYLRCEAFELNAHRKGFTLLRFREVNLGFINHLGNRFNNLYPTHWRLRNNADFKEDSVL